MTVEPMQPFMQHHFSDDCGSLQVRSGSPQPQS